MEILRWNERFSVGSSTIDLQHKMLFNFANYLTTGSGQNFNRQETEEILDELLDYTVYHFNYEEELLAKHPHIEEHRAKHAEFKAKAILFVKEFKEGKKEINSELFSYLVQWIRNHITKEDIRYFGDIYP